MKAELDLKREFRYADKKTALIYAALSALAGLVSLLFCKGMRNYYRVLVPFFAPSAGVLVFFFIIMLALCGFAFGFAEGIINRCGRKNITGRLILFLSLIITECVKFPVFFALCSFITGVILSLVAAILSFALLRTLVVISRVSGFCMLIFLLWELYCSLLFFCILLLN